MSVDNFPIYYLVMSPVWHDTIGGVLRVFSCDVENKEEIIKLFEDIKSEWGQIDFVVHAVAFSDKSELSGEYLNTTRENFLRSMLISCFSFTEVSKEASKLMKEGGSMLTLTYESTKAIPNYNVMGVCKSALEASVKYLALLPLLCRRSSHCYCRYCFSYYY